MYHTHNIFKAHFQGKIVHLTYLKTWKMSKESAKKNYLLYKAQIIFKTHLKGEKVHLIYLKTCEIPKREGKIIF